MLERREIRVLVPYSRTLYFNDRGAQRGLTADTLRDFEVFLNRKFKPKGHPLVVVALPTTRERMIPGLLEGRADIAAGNLTITPARDRKVDFSKPMAEGIAEIIVTRSGAPPLASLEELGGREIHVRASSSYHASLKALNARLRAAGKPEARIVLVDEALEDEDLMDMLSAGMLQLTVVDSWKARLWAGMRPRLKPRPDLALTEGGSIGWAFREGSPQLAAAINEFIDRYPGARAKRIRNYPAYLKELGNITADADWKRFERSVALFRKYGKRYDFDYLMLVALGYQESRLDQDARSAAGAIGVMQILPETAATLGVGDITQLEPNIHGGTKYLRQLRKRYVSGGNPDAQNQTLFAIASYNAGPSRISALRGEAPKLGLDPDVWFGNVERVAARRVGEETVSYVRNIYKYYVAYKLQLETLEQRRAAVKKAGAKKSAAPAD
jgi:membrane-bound lytic murein transglycosylase MltF